MHPFSAPWKQGVEKGCVGNKLVKKWHLPKLLKKIKWVVFQWLNDFNIFFCQKQSFGGVLLKKVFLTNSQNSQENAFASVFFLLKLQA